MSATLLSYLPSLVLTLAIETGFVFLAARREQQRDAVLACVALNLMTHPIVTGLHWTRRVDLLSLELVTFLVEWLGYIRLLAISGRSALRFALFANLISTLVGILIWFL